MTSIDPAIAAELGARGVTRLLHFTPARNLPRILTDRRVRAVRDLSEDVRAVYAHTDPQRLDGHTDKISCSIEFPNAFYLQRVRDVGPAKNYPDWAFLVLDPIVAATPQAMFCPRNAAAASGGLLRPGVIGLRQCFTPSVAGAYGRIYTRDPQHHPSAPTDAQAEVLVPGPIALSKVLMIACPTAEHVAEEHSRLARLGVNPEIVAWGFSPVLFSPTDASNAARTGRSVAITSWTSGGAQ